MRLENFVYIQSSFWFRRILIRRERCTPRNLTNHGERKQLQIVWFPRKRQLVISFAKGDTSEIYIPYDTIRYPSLWFQLAWKSLTIWQIASQTVSHGHNLRLQKNYRMQKHWISVHRTSFESLFDQRLGTKNSIQRTWRYSMTDGALPRRSIIRSIVMIARSDLSPIRVRFVFCQAQKNNADRVHWIGSHLQKQQFLINRNYIRNDISDCSG